ncbi:MAG TPA: diguanylate cyclase [Gemmatimonadaceae bacterium]|nr:diguanylate cyclase [Gemmatimonadaceae bacterium]
MAQTPAILFAPNGVELPAPLGAWVQRLGAPLLRLTDAEELMGLALRGRPRLVIVDARSAAAPALDVCRRLKEDSYTGVVPCVVLGGDGASAVADGFAAGADEVVGPRLPDDEYAPRLDALLRRSDRDTLVHPSTRLPGTVEIERELTRRLALGAPFATCYADLDHFKEFNDRYSYYDGDRVIRILAKILHDVVKGVCKHDGFVGHIGGDDFIFVIPAAAVNEVCAEVLSIFDALMPYQYSEQDRRAGYFFGKDRRGQLHRVPLMTVSIGVVTNERRHFTHAAQVSELATEMKSYAKTLEGSVFTIDRRHDSHGDDAAPSVQRADAGRAVETS